MANNINLMSGRGITLELDNDSDTLSITISKTGLNDILKDLEDDSGSVLKSILTSITNLTTNISNLDTRLSAVEKAITIDDEFINAASKPATVSDTLSKNWVRSLIDTYAVNTTDGLIDYGTVDPNESGGANSRAKIYVKY